MESSRLPPPGYTNDRFLPFHKAILCPSGDLAYDLVQQFAVVCPLPDLQENHIGANFFPRLRTRPGPQANLPQENSQLIGPGRGLVCLGRAHPNVLPTRKAGDPAPSTVLGAEGVCVSVHPQSEWPSKEETLQDSRAVRRNAEVKRRGSRMSVPSAHPLSAGCPRVSIGGERG